MIYRRGHTVKAIFKRLTFLALAAGIHIFLLAGCQDTIKLPVDQGGVTGSGDTVFIKLNPPWDITTGVDLSQPTDIIIGPDGLVYIADTGNDRITVLNRSGFEQTGENLDNIGAVDNPTGIVFDNMLNLYICNGSDTVYSWNRYLNNYGVVGAALEFTMLDTVSGETLILTEAEDFVEYAYGQPDPDKFWVLVDISWDFSPEAIDEAMRMKAFYVSPTSQFYAAAVDPIAGNVLYFTDPAKQRIYRVRAEIDKMVALGNGLWGYTYKAAPLGTAISYGTGKLTCDQPRGITFDEEGYMLFSQVGGNFKIQKIAQDNFAAFNIFGFNDSSDVMIEGRFANPADVCIGLGSGTGTGWIYAADTDSNRVQVFDADGVFLMNAGFRPLPVDTSVVDTVITQIDSVTFDTSYVITDTVLVLEMNDELSCPAGVAVFDGVLYICDTDYNRIMRYGLSSSEGDLPGQGY
ncbi:MAG: hypothetical protein H8E46_05425 [FCB group bacterium]|nr:hypothetical protein [FCB group bacterium]